MWAPFPSILFWSHFVSEATVAEGHIFFFFSDFFFSNKFLRLCNECLKWACLRFWVAYCIHDCLSTEFGIHQESFAFENSDPVCNLLLFVQNYFTLEYFYAISMIYLEPLNTLSESLILWKYIWWYIGMLPQFCTELDFMSWFLVIMWISSFWCCLSFSLPSCPYILCNLNF